MYAILAAKAASQRRLPVAAVIGRHWDGYLAGSYLRCDVQTMPEAIADLFGEVAFLVPALRRMPRHQRPTWSELTERWNAS